MLNTQNKSRRMAAHARRVAASRNKRMKTPRGTARAARRSKGICSAIENSVIVVITGLYAGYTGKVRIARDNKVVAETKGGESFCVHRTDIRLV